MSSPSMTLKWGSANSFFNASRLTDSSTPRAMNGVKSESPVRRAASSLVSVSGAGGASVTTGAAGGGLASGRASAEDAGASGFAHREKKSLAAMLFLCAGHQVNARPAFEGWLLALALFLRPVIRLHERAQPFDDFG